MASSLPSPPSTPQPESKLISRLDALLEFYLDLLDTYTTLRAQLSKDLSSGFFSLAQANRSSTLGPGRRYGEEGYDERMKALKRVRIERQTRRKVAEHEKSESREETEKPGDIEKTVSTDKDDTKAPTIVPAEDVETPHFSYNFTISPASLPPSPSKETLSPTATSRPTLPHRNPLTWYGILSPPALRQTQTHFTTAVSSTIPMLLSTLSALEALQAQIHALREKMGLDKADGEELPATSETASTATSALTTPTQTTKMPSPVKQKQPLKQKQVLVSRPAEPRSRVLKMG